MHRIYSLKSAKNSESSYDLNGVAHAIRQFGIEYVAVSLNDSIEVINVMAKCKVRSIQMSGMFQLSVLVHPDQTYPYFDRENFV